MKPKGKRLLFEKTQLGFMTTLKPLLWQLRQFVAVCFCLTFPLLLRIFGVTKATAAAASRDARMITAELRGRAPFPNSKFRMMQKVMHEEAAWKRMTACPFVPTGNIGENVQSKVEKRNWQGFFAADNDESR